MASLADVRVSLRGLRRNDVRSLLRSLATHFREDDIASLAAGVAFRIFLSLFPAMFAAIAAFSIVVSGQQMVALLEAADFIPEQVRGQIERPMVAFVERPGGVAPVTVVAGVLGGMWAATSAAVMLARALTRIYGFTETRRFIAQRLTGIAIAVAMFIALVALVLLMVAGGALQRRALDALVLTSEAEDSAAVVLTVGRVLLSVLVLVILFAFIYWVGPDRSARSRFQWLTPGAVLAVAGWIGLSALFGLYTRIAGENEVYGALGGIIVLLLWLQLTMVILLVGAEVNSLLRRFAVARVVGGEAANGGWPSRDGAGQGVSQAPDRLGRSPTQT